MNIEYLRSNSAAKTNVQELKQSAEKTAGKDASQEIVNGNGSDRLSISSEARHLQHTDQVVRSEIKKLPDIRSEKVEAVLSRMKEGYYSSDEAVEHIADAIINHSSKAARKPEESTARVLLNLSDELPETRQTEVAAAKERSAANFYNNEEPLRKASDKLWIPPMERI
ncbi:MAG: flagellar biosynthesis anti-sigma factor FlgM [candidate division Zixibacteria bacterium]|nr:flagellar biosynthesis anti-sigma factor FlgM [Candidatus Tariuqbacter arcticus]